MGLIFFKKVRRKMNKEILLLPDPVGTWGDRYKWKEPDYCLNESNCPMWCLGIFCIQGYEKHIFTLQRILWQDFGLMDHLREDLRDYSTNDSTKDSTNDSTKYSTNGSTNGLVANSTHGLSVDSAHKPTVYRVCPWGNGKVHCMWPEFAGTAGSDPLEQRTIISKGTGKKLCDENFEKIVKLIDNPGMQRNLLNAVADVPVIPRIFRYSQCSYILNYPKQNTEGIISIFQGIVDILNAIFWKSGLVFDTENITKSDLFASTATGISKQVNVRIENDQFVRHILLEDHPEPQELQLPKISPSKPIHLRNSNNSVDTNVKTKLKRENHKAPPCATLIVASGEDPRMGGGYGAIRNCGIEIPRRVDLDHYMGHEDEMTKAKLENKCKLQHHIIANKAAKYGIDRQCMCHIGYDYTFWQVSHLSDNPEFSKWHKGQDLPTLSEHNFREVDLERYPEVKYDESSLFFNENEDPGVFYRLVCVTLDSLFELIPELKNDELLKATVNGQEPDKLAVQNLHEWLQRGIKERAPLFQEYLKNYEQYHPKNMSWQTEELLKALPSRDINSCSIVSDLSTSTQEAYKVKVDDLEVQNETFELLLFPVKNNNFTGGVWSDIVNCIPDFKHCVRVFNATNECEYAANMYDYGKLEYIDEYGNEQLKLFILKEKTCGRVPRDNDEGDRELVKSAKKRLQLYCSKEELMKISVMKSAFPVLNTDYEESVMFGKSQLEELRGIGIYVMPDFRVVDESYAKLFGYVTHVDEKLFLQKAQEKIV